jgi:hypothetical protein
MRKLGFRRFGFTRTIGFDIMLLRFVHQTAFRRSPRQLRKLGAPPKELVDFQPLSVVRKSAGMTARFRTTPALLGIIASNDIECPA